VAKELLFCVRGSTDGARCSGIVKRISLRIIREEILLLSSRIWQQRYFKNASEDHRPMSMIMYTGVSTMNMTMAAAAADRLECVLMSSGLKPSFYAVRRSDWVNYNNFPSII